MFATYSNSVLSFLVKLLYKSLSKSITPTQMLSLMIGTTTSERDEEEQAIWPSNLLTSSTNILSFLKAEVPHTPLLKGISVQATGPWNGPRYKMSSFSFFK